MSKEYETLAAKIERLRSEVVFLWVFRDSKRYSQKSISPERDWKSSEMVPAIGRVVLERGRPAMIYVPIDFFRTLAKEIGITFRGITRYFPQRIIQLEPGKGRVHRCVGVEIK